MTIIEKDALVELTADIVSAYVSKNPVPAAELPALIDITQAALARLGSAETTASPVSEPAVPIRRSVRNEHIVCLEDGKKFKSLRRHLGTEHGMTPAQYRAKWNLPSTYPMVAPSYSMARSKLAKEAGLGRKTTQAARTPRRRRKSA